MSLIEPGQVWLVGAGPGDPDLLTRKAERLLQQASVVFYDALVGEGVLDLIPAQVRQVFVGKRSGRHSKEQATIDRLLVDAALAGERVVRLKGGDPAVFGRADEELRACRAAGIAVRMCPGITAASAAAASLCQSLTLRGLSRRLTLMTAHTGKNQPAVIDVSAVADPEATLAVYMGKSAATSITQALLAAGLPGDTPMAIVENASLPGERVLRTRVDLLPIAARSLGDGPAIILIGAALRPQGQAGEADASLLQPAAAAA